MRVRETRGLRPTATVVTSLREAAGVSSFGCKKLRYAHRAVDSGFALALPFRSSIFTAARLVDGVVAQLVERLVRNEKVRGSTPLGSTIQ